MKKSYLFIFVLFILFSYFAPPARAGEIDLGLFSPSQEKKISQYLGTYVPEVVKNVSQKASLIWESPPVIIKSGGNVIFLRIFVVGDEKKSPPKVYVSWKKIQPDNFRRVLDIVGDNYPLGKGGVARLK